MYAWTTPTLSERQIADATGRTPWAVHQQLVAIYRRQRRGQSVTALMSRLFARRRAARGAR